MCQMPVFCLGDHVADAVGGELLQYQWMHGFLLDPLRGRCGLLRAVGTPREDVAAQIAAGPADGLNDVGVTRAGPQRHEPPAAGCGPSPDVATLISALLLGGPGAGSCGLSASALLASGGGGVWDIGQLADVAAGRACTMGLMEIRIVLDQVEPPGGCLRVVPGAGQAQRPAMAGEIRFTGWLGLLKALYEVTGPADPGLPGGA